MYVNIFGNEIEDNEEQPLRTFWKTVLTDV